MRDGIGRQGGGWGNWLTAAPRVELADKERKKMKIVLRSRWMDGATIPGKLSVCRDIKEEENSETLSKQCAINWTEIPYKICSSFRIFKFCFDLFISPVI